MKLSRGRPALVASLLASALLVAACSGETTGSAPEPPTPTEPAATGSPAPATPSRSASGGPTASRTSAAACVDRVLGKLSPREQAAQLVMTGISAKGMTSSERAIVREQRPGGLLLIGAGGSLGHTRAAVSAAAEASTSGSVRPLVAADQEGGRIQRLKGDGFDRIPSAGEQGEWPAAQLTTRAAGWGRQLREAGVNLDLAPVADVVPAAVGDRNEPVGALDRAFGSTPGPVAEHVAAFVRGMAAAGELTAVKHFPGLGRVRGNTDFSSGVTDDTTVRDDPLLAPFAAGIRAGADLVMIATATYSRIDPDNRAVFSRTVIEGMLRGDLGYDGVVISDDVGAAAEVASVPVGQRATRFVAAGGDIVITAEASLTRPMIDALAGRADDDREFAATLRAGVRRVLSLKQRHGLVDCG